MLIGQAFAQDAATTAAGAAAGAGADGNAFWFNMGMIAVMFIAFYVILIRPQQRRMREQQEMIDALKKGDRVVTAGGLVGKITKLTNDREVEIEIAKDVKVTALRYTLSADMDMQAANDSKAGGKDKAEKEGKKDEKKKDSDKK